MNILIDSLPDRVKIGGAEYAINADFRTSLKFKLIMDNEDLTEEEKAYNVLELYYPDIPEDIEQAFNKIVWFYCEGETEEEKESKGKGIPFDEIVSYTYDSKLIHSAFKQQYSVDLSTENIHWWKFKAWFSSLSEETEIKKIMNIRMMDLKEIEDDKTRDYYKKLKEQVKIPTSRDKKEKEAEDEFLKELLKYQ